ncbi:MAG: HD domain-containing protein [Candidatus Riflebacteria bacterium]|nr:HD domain-containing protein [Candidatus Riflebacteria bacterium]
MIKEPRIQLNHLVSSLSAAVDLVSPVLVNHHKQVAYTSFCLASELGIPMEEKSELVLAGLLHDIGAVSLKDRMDYLRFELEIPHQHSRLGYFLLRIFEPLSNVSKLIKYHHVFYEDGKGLEFEGNPVPKGSHILHLADRISVLFKFGISPLSQAQGIVDSIVSQDNRMFMPELTEAFRKVATRESFWLDLGSNNIAEFLQRRVRYRTIELDTEGLLKIGNIFRRIIDFRSPFTATHSSGVAASGKALGKLAHFSWSECRMLKIAGFLHDLGKLAVPTEILEKTGPLTKEEFNVVKAHTFFTYRVLESIEDLNTITSWGAFHHERLDGSGYPFHLGSENLHLGARIMAVADVFTAITEDRPYRKGMTSESALKVLIGMAKSKSLDGDLVELLKENYDEMNSIRNDAQADSINEYREFWSQL